MSWVWFCGRLGSPISPHCYSGRGLLRSLWPDTIGQVPQALGCGVRRYAYGWHRSWSRLLFVARG